MKKVLILGAGSDVAMACAEIFAKNGYAINLAGRRSERFEAACTDLKIRFNCEIEATEFDADNYSSHQAYWDNLSDKPEVTICAFGYLGDQENAEKSIDESLKIISANYTGAVSILNVISSYYSENKKGSIIGISSVAGERGRMSNYLYGSAKAGFTAYLSGLRNNMFHKKVHVLTVKPGFMDTKMTEGLDLPKPLTAQPEEAAAGIYKAFQKKKNVVYIKPIWALIMLIIKNIPEFIFKKLKL